VDEAELVEKRAAGEPTLGLKCAINSWLSSSSSFSLAGCEAFGLSIVTVGGARAHALGGDSGNDVPNKGAGVKVNKLPSSMAILL